MRVPLLSIVLLASVAAPAMAQRAETPERRIERLERELRAVQRRVFPGGQPVEPEIQPQAQPISPIGSPSADALTNLTARVDALESQLRSLTGQVEEGSFRVRQLETALSELRSDTDRRFTEAAAARAAPPVSAEPAQPAPVDEPAASQEQTGDAPAPSRATSDPAEAAYNTGFRLWEQRRFADAQRTLETAAEAHPNSRWASWARNLAGRAYLDDGKPATAARVLLANYQQNPRGERAADSLYFLGQALTRLNRRTEACRVYDELAEVYPNMRDYLRTRLPQARTDARCGASGGNAR